jgi:prophage antirepressor-like protein
MSNYSNQSSNSAITPFNFEGNEVRIIVDNDGEFWFVAKDVCDVLDIKNTSDALSRLDDDEKDGVVLNDTIGRPQQTAIVNEPGLYTLVMGSRKPEAKTFKRWIAHEVLPSLRKTGNYNIQQHNDPITANIAMIRSIADSLEDFHRRQNALEVEHHQLEERIDRLDNKNRMFTVVAYAREHNLALHDGQASIIGRRAAKLSRHSDVAMGQVYDARWGYVYSYREDILAEAWDGDE